MNKASRFLGKVMHSVNRAISVLVSAYYGWTLRSYIMSKARKCGSIYIAGNGRFAHVEHLEVGENVHVNTGAYWVCEGGLRIGDNTIFASNVTIYTRNHNYHGCELPFDNTNIFRAVEIGRNVWVGANVTVLPGAKIGDGAIIGAGAVVAGEVPAGAIFGAQPSTLLKYRDPEHYERLDRENVWHRPRYIFDIIWNKWRSF